MPFDLAGTTGKCCRGEKRGEGEGKREHRRSAGGVAPVNMWVVEESQDWRVKCPFSSLLKAIAWYGVVIVSLCIDDGVVGLSLNVCTQFYLNYNTASSVSSPPPPPPTSLRYTTFKYYSVPRSANPH